MIDETSGRPDEEQLDDWQTEMEHIDDAISPGAIEAEVGAEHEGGKEPYS